MLNEMFSLKNLEKKRSAVSRILSRLVIYLRFALLQNFSCLPLINARAELN